MSYNYYKVINGSLDQLYSSVCAKCSTWNTSINALANCYTQIIDMKEYQGESADSVKNYFQEVHGVLLYAIQQAIASYQSELLLYKTGYYNIDSSIYASLPQEILQNVKTRFMDELQNLDDISTSIGNSLGSVTDIFFEYNPTNNLLSSELDGMKFEINELDRNVETYEEENLNLYNEKIKVTLDALQAAIQGYLSNERSITSYESGDITGDTYVLDLYQKVQVCAEELETKQEEIEEAIDVQQTAYDQMQADYEAACEAREDEGWAKVIMGVVTAGVGFVAIVGTAGMATPIVVAATASGTCTMAYGISNASEGAQDIYYGSIGDLDSVAINPIRDTVFSGNQEMYEVWGNLNMTIAGLCVPTGKAINGVAGASNSAMAKATIKVVGKEIFKDQALDFTSEKVTGFVTEQFTLNQAQATMLNLGFGALLDKGTDFAGDKISGNSGSFVEKMSYEDAKRYNQRDLAIEQGTYNNFPGLNSEDIAAWKFADLKVDEHVIVSNIDADVAFDLSEADVDIQSDFATGIANASEYGGKIKLDDLDEVDSFYDEIYEQQSTSCDSYEVYLGDLRELHLESIAGVEGGTDAINNLKPQNLMDELASSGVKYNPDDVIAVTKTADGKLVWLENGTDTAGLNHIITEHADDFLNKGITQEQIPDYVMNALENGKIVGYQGRGTGRPIYEFTYNGEIHKVAITVGDNGFVVGANPK
ncbi:MAG: hypothetical protein IJX86_11870 [Lachnospiraceae bacterium]|nr:hypothetical protein [Lachnospiraceae bacterium]